MERATEQEQLLKGLDRATRLVVAAGLDYVDTTHSYSGNPETDPAAELYKPYHNGLHTRGVVEATKRATKALDITGEQRSIAVIAAAFHDVVHDLDATGNANEKDSAEEMMYAIQRQPNVTSSKILHYGVLAVLGTNVTFTNGQIIQSATTQEYPTKKAEAVAHAVAAADLAKLYSPDGPIVNHQYFKELSAGASGKTPRIADLLAFQKNQSIILSTGYRYPNDTLQKLFTSKKDEVLTYYDTLIADLEAERIESWEDITRRDQAFFITHC